MDKQIEKQSSINYSFQEIDAFEQNKMEEEKLLDNYDQNGNEANSSRISEKENFNNREASLNSFNTNHKDNKNVKSSGSNSDKENPGFTIHNEDEHKFSKYTSSSIEASSKSSVGFLKDFYQLVELIKYRSNDRLKEELIKSDNDIYGPIDMSKKTLLHYAGEFNSLDVCKTIIEILFLSGVKKPFLTLKEWLNSITTNGLTALHFAAYRGNNQLIKYLVSLGANVHSTDSDGHNGIHIAAQADKINTIYFLLKNYEFDINKGDNKLSTALHWAAFLNKENALSFLLAWGADPNLQDIDNNTPLHLSVILSCKSGNTRNVKLLLLKGASREIENNDNYVPIDLVSNEMINAKELRSILSKPTFLSCGMLKPPLTKLNKNNRTVVFFILQLLVMIFLSFFYIIPSFKSLAVTIISGILVFPILISFTVITLKDPGYLKKHPNVDFQELLDTLDPLDIGPEGEIILTPRGRHGNICNKGVERFDHHCPYINNCVGYNNHAYFLMYIASLGVNLAYLFIITLIAVTTKDREREAIFDDMKSDAMFYISGSIILGVTGIFVLPVLFLVFIHCTNFAKNKTTNERFSKQKVNNTTLTTKMNTSSARSSDQNSLLDNYEFNSFMGVPKRNGFANGLMMGDYRPPSQIELKNEILKAD